MDNHLRAAALPLFVGIIPIVFLYSNNSKVLNLTNLLLPVVLVSILAIVLYFLFYLVQHSTSSASLSAVILLGVNYLYGIVYQALSKQNIFQIEHRTMLPILIYLAIYAAYFFKNIVKPGTREAIQKIFTLMSAALVIYNAVIAIPIEVQKHQVSSPESAHVVMANTNSEKKFPDVYFIVLDEYAGFESVRNYWHKDYVDDFEQFLKENGFFIVANARSNTMATNLELASRLNMKQYSHKTDTVILHQLISDNKVMKIFKEYGYTTVVFQEPFPRYVNADYYFNLTNVTENAAVGTAEFHKVLIENSFLLAFSDLLQKNDSSVTRLKAINLTFDTIANFQEVDTPKLVIVHLLFPHVPFITDKDGNPIDPKHQYDWNYYIGQHEYATKQAQALLARLLKQADPDNPPVIIIQSDHGARNDDLPTRDSITFPDYPIDYGKQILFALYLPGVDTSDLTDTTHPMESFVIVLNKYMNAGVTVDMSEDLE